MILSAILLLFGRILGRHVLVRHEALRELRQHLGPFLRVRGLHPLLAGLLVERVEPQHWDRVEARLADPAKIVAPLAGGCRHNRDFLLLLTGQASAAWAARVIRAAWFRALRNLVRLRDDTEPLDEAVLELL